MRFLLALTGILCVQLAFGQVPNSWVKKNDFGGLKRERAVAFTANGYGFIGTGIDTAEVVRKDFWRYDDVTDSWSQVADLPGSERRNAVAFSINDYGYVATGMNTATSTDVGATKLTDMWRYDATLNQWTQMSPYPFGVYFSAAFTVDGKGYVVGGKLGPNNYTSLMYSYDPTTDQWSAAASFAGGIRYQLSALSIDGKGYAGLGTDQDLYRNDWWEYKPSTNSWAQRADLPASERSGAATFTIGSRGFVCMGTNGGVLDDLWEYNPYSNSWSSRAPYGGSPRKNAAAFVLGSRAYVGTGKGISGKKQSMQEYHPMSSLGVDDNDIVVRAYPNPATDLINVELNASFDELALIDMNGQQVRIVRASTMHVSDIAPGRYFLSVRDNTQEIGIKNIVIH